MYHSFFQGAGNPSPFTVLLEVPSMALEKFTSDQQLLQRVAKHFETAKELDGASISKIQEQRGPIDSIGLP